MKIILLIKSLKPLRREHWMVLSILVYSMVGVLKYYLPNSLTNAITVLSAVVFIWIVLKNASGLHVKGITAFFYGILILWSIWLTFHMFFIDNVRDTFTEYHGMTTWLLAYFGSMMFLPNLMPFVILAFPRNYQFDFKYLWRVMLLMCIMYLCYYPFAFWNMTHYTWSFDTTAGTDWGDKGTYGDFISNSSMGIANLLPAVIMIYLKKYIPSKQWKCFLVSYIGSILILAFMARRGGLALSILYLAMAWGMYAINDKRTSKIKMLLLAVVVIGLCGVLFTNMADSFLSTLIERGNEDTRGGVEDGFYADMKTQSDWLFGRGWFGQYYEPTFGKYRSSIETGFLALILRGGYLYLVPYVSLLALTFFNGYFRSRNVFCKSFAIICLMQIVSLYPFGWPTFDFFHFTLWIGVWLCNSPQLRRMTDTQIASRYF